MHFSRAVCTMPSRIRVLHSSFQRLRNPLDLRVRTSHSIFYCLSSPHVASRTPASQVIRGRTQICDQLLALGQYQFIPRGVPQNPIYTWSIPKMPGVRDGILLSLHGEIVKTGSTPAMDHRLTVDQTFLLRQRTADDDTDDDDGTDMCVLFLYARLCVRQLIEMPANCVLPDSPGQTNLRNFWPLAVVSHQMAARSNPLLDVDELKGRLGWIHDILQ